MAQQKILAIGGLPLFVQGPPADTTQDALQELLAKTEEMIGDKWKNFLYGKRDFLDK